MEGIKSLKNRYENYVLKKKCHDLANFPVLGTWPVWSSIIPLSFPNTYNPNFKYGSAARICKNISLAHPGTWYEMTTANRPKNLWVPSFSWITPTHPHQRHHEYHISYEYQHPLLLSPLDPWNLWNPFNSVRIIMGKFGCTQIWTSSSCSSERKKDFGNLFFWIRNILPRGWIGMLT